MIRNLQQRPLHTPTEPATIAVTTELQLIEVYLRQVLINMSILVTAVDDITSYASEGSATSRQTSIRSENEHYEAHSTRKYDD